MKHNLRITNILLIAFLMAQFIGLFILSNYIDPIRSAETGKVEFKELPIGERPPLEESTSYIPITLIILVGTGVILLLIKFKLFWIWKFWFLLAVVLALTVAFNAFIPSMIAFILAGFLGLWKIFKPNFWVHTGTELFIYGGLAAIFAPIFSLLSVSILLVIISFYDAYAVWKSKHMVTLAKTQVGAKMFAGLFIPYQGKKILSKQAKRSKRKIKQSKVTGRVAILGGGDIGFPLIFAGVVLKDMGLWQSLVIPFFAALGLGFLLYRSREKKFYPAMPFISAGCFLGLLVVWLTSMV